MPRAGGHGGATRPGTFRADASRPASYGADTGGAPPPGRAEGHDLGTTSSTTGRPARARAVASASGVALLVLALVVHLGPTQRFDEAFRQWARPDDVWGPLQVRVDVIVEGLRPVLALLLLAVVTAVAALARRSLRPLVVTAAAGLFLVTVTVGIKVLLHRPDPHGALSDHGGSFPSGHTATVVVCAGLATMLLRPGARSWWWLPTLLLGTSMAAALVVQAAHWVTDVIGGGLVGVMVLATVAALGADRWCAGGPLVAPVARPGSGAGEA